MINQSEIFQNSRKFEVPTTTIDKDWVLGHFLNAMFSYTETRQYLVFKGGTCLRKIYFENYRFSEDLDFTLLDDSFVVDEKLIKMYFDRATAISGIKFYLFTLKPQIFEDKEQGYEIAIKYWGANHKKNQKPLPTNRWQDTIKIDLSFSETLVDLPESKAIWHPYTDNRLITNTVTSYSIDEIIAEKLRSLIQRNRPRDIYDNYFFSKSVDKTHYAAIKKILFIKALHKDIEIEGVDQFVNKDKRDKNQRAWMDSLRTQFNEKQIPDFVKAYDALRPFIEKILNS